MKTNIKKNIAREGLILLCVIAIASLLWGIPSIFLYCCPRMERPVGIYYLHEIENLKPDEVLPDGHDDPDHDNKVKAYNQNQNARRYAYEARDYYILIVACYLLYIVIRILIYSLILIYRFIIWAITTLKEK